MRLVEKNCDGIWNLKKIAKFHASRWLPFANNVREIFDISALRHLLSPEREKIGDSKFRNGTHRRRFRTVRFPLRASERLCYFVRLRCRSGVPLPWPARTRILVSWLVRAENNSRGNSYVDKTGENLDGFFTTLSKRTREFDCFDAHACNGGI